jgi:hypothetical protein
MKLLSITSFALVLSLLEIGSYVAVEAKRPNVLRGGRTIQQQQQQQFLTNKKTSLSNGIKNDNIHRETQSREGINDESSITTTITVEDEEEMSSNSDQIDMPAQVTGEIMMEDIMEDNMESENQDEEGMMEIVKDMMDFEEEFYDRKVEEEYEEELEGMTMESYYNDEYDLENGNEDQEAPSVITLEPEEEGRGKFDDNDAMYYDNEMTGELTDENFDEMMGDMYYATTDSSGDFVENSLSTSEEEEVAFEMEEMGEVEEMGEMEDMGDMISIMTLEPAE